MIYTYKPGWVLDFSDEGLLHIQAPALNAYSGAPYLLTYTLGCDGTPAGVREVIRRLEMHEVDEWLMVDGERVRTPHGPGIDPDPG